MGESLSTQLTTAPYLAACFCFCRNKLYNTSTVSNFYNRIITNVVHSHFGPVSSKIPFDKPNYSSRNLMSLMISFVGWKPETKRQRFRTGISRSIEKSDGLNCYYRINWNLYPANWIPHNSKFGRRWDFRLILIIDCWDKLVLQRETHYSHFWCSCSTISTNNFKKRPLHDEYLESIKMSVGDFTWTSYWKPIEFIANFSRWFIC